MAASFKKTMLELVVLGVFGLLVGFGANAVRGSGSIKINENYFPDDPFQTVTFAEAVAVFDD